MELKVPGLIEMAGTIENRLEKALQICATPLFSMDVDLATSGQEGLCQTHVCAKPIGTQWYEKRCGNTTRF